MERAQSASEREWLENLLANLPTAGRRTKEAVENFFVLLAVMTLLGVLVWSGIAWLTKKASGVDIGWSSVYAFPVVFVVLAASVVYAAYSTTRWMNTWPDSRQSVRDDLQSGIVSEEKLRLLDAKLLQEPEHGGLIYFLRADDGRIYVYYDDESVELAMADEDPLGSSFEPLTYTSIVTAPKSGFTIEVCFGGDSIDIYGPTAITVPPRKWPENQKFSSIAWDQLEAELCS